MRDTRPSTRNDTGLRWGGRAWIRATLRGGAGGEGGGGAISGPRHWHEDTGETTSGRSKEEAEDYRYFPEPDLVPLAPSREWVEQLGATLPESPPERRARLQAEWGFSYLELRDVINAGALELVEATVAGGASAAGAKKWWLGEIARAANERGLELDALGVTPADVARIEALIAAGGLNDKLARQVFEGVLAGEGSPDEVIAARGLALVSDDSALAAAVDEAVAAMPEVADKVRAGNLKAIGPLVGAVMKATRGQADAARARELIVERLT